ncbi:hypothetical protein Tco_1037506, partial [Tanacetum coccineum]
MLHKVDNSEKFRVNDKVDADKMEHLKEFLVRKGKLAALVEKVEKQQLNKALRKNKCGKMMTLESVIVSVPKDLEGMKQYISVSLKKASEMVDLVDEVLDEGLADYPDEAGFIRVEDDQGTEDIGGLLDGVQNYVSHETPDIPDIEGEVILTPQKVMETPQYHITNAYVTTLYMHNCGVQITFCGVSITSQ